MSWQGSRVAADQTHHVLDGRPLYERRFDSVLPFHAPGLAPVRRRDLAWHIDSNGREAYARRFVSTFGFYEGFAAVTSQEGWHHIRPDGADLSAARYEWCGNFQDGRCTVRTSDGYVHLRSDGAPAYATRWRYAGDFRERMAVVQRDDGRSTHIDEDSRPIHDQWFVDLDVFHKGFACARAEDGWTHVDATGRPVYEHRFARVEPFYNGQARVEQADGRRIVIDRHGETITELRPATGQLGAQGQAPGGSDGRPMRLAVIGTGRVGLVAGAGLAEHGHQVVCADQDEQRIACLLGGEVPIHEPQLEELVARNKAANRLSFTTAIAEAVAGADMVFLTVGTPHNELDGSADLRSIEEAARLVGRALTGFAVIVIKSTVPVGTSMRVRAIIESETSQSFAMAANPEFMKEGNAVDDFLRPDRVIVGVDDQRARETSHRLFTAFEKKGARIITMDIRSAELTKYAANAMLAVRISFINEMALLADQVGADIEQVRAGLGSDPRIGPEHLRPGPGFGGSCLPKDLRALLHAARQSGVSMEVVEAAANANVRQKRWLGARVKAHFGTSLAGRHLTIWGLAFKPDTDDIRESPALELIQDLLEAGAKITGYDPAATEPIRALYGDRIELGLDMYSATRGAHGLVVVTDWQEFRGAHLGRLKETMIEPILFDGRNLWNPEAVRQQGFVYYGIGRGARR